MSQITPEGLYMKGTLQKYMEERIPTTHLRGMFEPKLYDTTTIPLEIMRDKDIVAVDVLRGTNGNFNDASKWSAKEIIPPMYHEMFAINNLRYYERVFGSYSTSKSNEKSELGMEIASMVKKLNNKIIRAEELQCAQALETGVVTLVNGDSIDYRRKSESLVDNSATPWTTASTDVEGQLQAAGQFIREYGANNTGVMDITMSGQAWIALQKTTFFKDKANYNKVTLLAIGNPQNRNGATFHGQITAGSFIFNIWTYDGSYLDSADVRTRITDTLKVIVTPSEGARFELAYGALDVISKSNGATSMSVERLTKAAADYYVWDNVDRNRLIHSIHMTSAPIARLITVDQVYTMKVATSWTAV